MKNMLCKKGVIILNKKIICLVSFLILMFGTVSFAKYESSEMEEKLENIETINANDIGIRTIQKEVVKNEIIVSENENSDLDESPVYTEKVENEEPDYIESTKTEKENQEQEEAESVEEEDLDIPFEGMYEGYVSGEYFHVNCYDCELHDGCYKCEECTLVEEIDYNEELKTYIKEKFCIVCGHGGCESIDEGEFE